jgi:hypothetical protein
VRTPKADIPRQSVAIGRLPRRQALEHIDGIGLKEDVETVSAFFQNRRRARLCLAVSCGVLQPTEQRIAAPQGGRDPGNRLSILPVARYTARPIHSCAAVSKIRSPLPGSKSHCQPFPGPTVR